MVTVKLSSGRLQDLWNAIKDACTAQRPTTIDLEGAAFSGRVNGLQLEVCIGTKAMYDKAFNIATVHPVTVQNGQVDLGRYGLHVSAGTCWFRNVQIRGEGPAWRRRAMATLVHVTGRAAQLQLEGSSLQCYAEEPLNTMLIDQGAHVAMQQSQVSHSHQALGVKVLGGTLDAYDTDFSGHHESLAILTTPSSKPAAAAAGNGQAQGLGQPQPKPNPSDELSMVKLQRCNLSGSGAGAMGTVCSVVGSRSSLTASQCVIRSAAVGAVVSRGAWLVIEECTISDSSVAGVWCSGGHAQSVDCQFLNHPQPAVRVERKGSIELRRCTFTAPDSLPPGATAVGLSIDGAGAFARSVDCHYDGFGPAAIVETAGGSFLVEEGVENATRLTC